MSAISKKKAIEAPIVLPATRELVTTGKKDVVPKWAGKRDAEGRKPTTSKALILRNGKGGSFGTGEMMLTSKMSGREKLDLLAEDYTEKSQKAVAAPFTMEKCMNIADSQYNAYLDDILNLQDPDLFFNNIASEVGARTPPNKGKAAPPALNNATFVAETIATRVHNSYMLASAWKLVLDTLGELKMDGLGDRSAQTDLAKDEHLRSRYLVLFDMVGKLVDIGQNNFSVLATTTPHYAQYFKPVPNADPESLETVFDRDSLKYACKSFLDSIIIELSFPQAPYSRRILYQILSEAVDESPREARRFPQLLWDAVGDMSVTIELQELLERPLLGPLAKSWMDQPREMPEEYEKWVDAQILSDEASKHITNFKDIIFPVSKTRQKSVLDTMWKCMNLNYKSVTGTDIETLWQLAGATNRTPQWHAVYVQKLHEDSDEGSDVPPGLMPLVKKGAGKVKKRLAIAAGGDDSNSNDSMPALQSVSDSSDDEEESDSDEDDNDAVDADEDSDDGYDTDEEDELRELMREAMDVAMENPEFFNPKADPRDFKDFEQLAEERKGNPFLKLLGSLRGRVFNSNPKLKTTTKTVPRQGFPSGKGPAKTAPKPTTIAKGKAGVPLTGPPQTTPNVDPKQPQITKVTMEEVEDEDATPGATKKKKKKKPKKKKKAGEVGEGEDPTSPGVNAPASLPTSPVKPPPPISPLKSAAQTSPSPSPAKKAVSIPKSPSRQPSLTPSSSTTLAAQMSTASLALPVEQTTAQSAHSYVKDLETKTKTKSRPDHASLFSESSNKKAGFFSKYPRKDVPLEAPAKKGSKHSWFSRLSKRTDKLMHQLLNTAENDSQGQASMRWEHFLKLMIEMGFSIDGSTAGSSVRFDPPDKKDSSITFHRPHPDAIIHPVMLRDFSKRLQKQYGWNQTDFLTSSG